MFVPTLIYAVLAVSGLIGSAIAWDDLKKALRKPLKPAAK